MKVVFTVEFPDDANVTMGGLASDEPPLPEPPSDLPARSHAELAQRTSAELCPVHNVAWRVVPAGVSKKTGEPYNAFIACPERGCNERPR